MARDCLRRSETFIASQMCDKGEKREKREGKRTGRPPARIVRYAYRLLNDPIERVTSVV